MNLKTLTWTASSGGIGPYYAYVSSGLSATNNILAITISGFGTLRRDGVVSTSEITFGYIDTNDYTHFMLLSDTNSFSNNESNMQYRLLYV